MKKGDDLIKAYFALSSRLYGGMINKNLAKFVKFMAKNAKVHKYI